jgi:hypothetical protein
MASEVAEPYPIRLDEELFQNPTACTAARGRTVPCSRLSCRTAGEAG